MISAAIIKKLSSDLRKLPRSEAWKPLLPLLVGAPAVRALLTQHVRDLRSLERFRKSRKGVFRTPLNRRLIGYKPSKKSGVCKGCGRPLSAHPLRHHLWVLEQRRRVKKSWAGLSPEQRALRTLPARTARIRAANDKILASFSPRLLAILGRRKVLERLNRPPI